MVTLLLKIEILTIKGEDLRKIPTGHEHNQVVKCEDSLHRGKDEKQDIVRMKCNCGIEMGTR